MAIPSKLKTVGTRVRKWSKDVIKDVNAFRHRHPEAFNALCVAVGAIVVIGSGVVVANALDGSRNSHDGSGKKGPTPEPLLDPNTLEYPEMLTAFMEGKLVVDNLSDSDQQALAHLIDESEGGGYFEALEDTFDWDRERIKNSHDHEMYPDLLDYLTSTDMGCSNEELGLLPDGSRDDS